ncbi:MAG TPA: N-acetylmuramoyl-L-alanine amidase [Bacillota bacterium]|nr:N-acetylmuramoyl-L-alanine amidase [Bacillota bacterium]
MTKSQRFWFMLITVFSFSLLLGPLTSYATPEQDEGVIEKGDVTDVLDIIKDKNLLNPKARKNQNGTVKVFLDPGHGGSDPGAHSNGLNEKDMVLDIALKTKEVLDNEYIGVETNMSRMTDHFVELLDRSIMANNWGADYFISFHLNSFDGSASGFESYIYNGNVSPETSTRQLHIHTFLADRLDVLDRGRKRANFSVLRNTAMPALLNEYMFIDNPRENEMLQEKSYRDYLGKLTADAIADTYDLEKK